MIRSIIHRPRGALRVLIVALTMVLGVGIVGTTPAHATPSPTYVSCAKPWGTTGYITLPLPATYPGVEVDIYLYKAVWNGRAYVPQYQNSYDWAVSNNNSGWQRGPYTVAGGLQVSTSGTGFFYVMINIFTPNGASSSQWSANGCTF